MEDKNNQQPNQPKRFSFANIAVILLAILIVVVMIFALRGCNASSKEINISEATEAFIDSDKYVNEAKIVVSPASDSAKNGSYQIKIVLKDNTSFYFYAPTEQGNIFINAALTMGYDVEYAPGSTISVWTILYYGVMIIGVVFIAFLLIRTISSARSTNDTSFEFGKSRAQLSKKTGITFNDVAGLDEEKEELKEIVDFLKDSKKYKEMGARVPKGVLLYGMPGTGKTLLARAVAGEANVPFFYTTGSDLVEMFVGVGASRVRDMFKTAKKSAPSILFMDEIDAVGRQRGTGLGGGNDEREQTLNQLLVEMDGFDADTNVIVIAATNRSDVLDPALLRPGRFDRQINVSVPDIKGREEILKVHARGKKVGSDVDFKRIAHETPGFTGADLENVMNEAALLAARKRAPEITQELVSEAIDRVILGPAKKSRVISKKEKEIVAYHEAGHCVIGMTLSNAQEVQKVTIIPRGNAGGYNLMGPKEEELFLRTKAQLYEEITGLLGGRTAEELIFGEITTGASDDMVKATNIARAMVTKYGMSSLGPIAYEQSDGYVFLGRDYASNKNFSDSVAHDIDQAVKQIIDECHNNAAKILNENIDKLKAIAHYLLIVETITKPDIVEIMETGHLKRVDDEENPLKDLGTEQAQEAPQEQVQEETKDEA